MHGENQNERPDSRPNSVSFAPMVGPKRSAPWLYCPDGRAKSALLFVWFSPMVGHLLRSYTKATAPLDLISKTAPDKSG